MSFLLSVDLIELIELDHFLTDFCVNFIVLIELDHFLEVFLCWLLSEKKQQATSLIVFVLVADFQPAL